MNIEGSIALVTGANRGLGAALCRALRDQGAAKVYAGARDPNSVQTPDEPVITSYANAPARTISTRGVTFAYRELGPRGGVPVIFFVHLAATLDNWDALVAPNVPAVAGSAPASTARRCVDAMAGRLIARAIACA